MDQQKIGHFIAELRKENNMTQAQLAEKLGVNVKSVSRWENGRTMPDYSIVMDLCNELHISLTELINGERCSNEENKNVESEEKLLESLRRNFYKSKITLIVAVVGVCFSSVGISMVWNDFSKMTFFLLTWFVCMYFVVVNVEK